MTGWQDRWVPVRESGRPDDRGLRVGGGLVAAAAVFAAAQAVLVNVGTGMIDAEAVRPWAWLVRAVIGVLAVVGVVLGVVLYRRDRAGAAAAADIGAGVERVVQHAHATRAGSTNQAGRDLTQITHIHPPPAPVAPVAPAAQSNLPPRNPAFTGRETLLGRVGRALAAGPVAVVAVRGLGGVGKSQAAVEYAHRGRESGVYDLVWRVRAETALTAAEDLAGLAPALGVPAGADQEETVAGVRAALQRRGRWLLVLDNVPNPQFVRGWLPTGPGRVLITSRDRGWASLGSQVDVDPFNRAESVAYLRARLGRDDPDADTLAATVGDLPLAMAQATAYLDEHGGLSVAGYLTLYRDREAAGRLLARQTGDGYPESVATTWLIHLTDLATNHPAALEVLRLCAYLDPDDIDLTLLLSQPELLDAQQELGELPAARANLRRALAIFEVVYGAEHPHTVLADRLLAELGGPPPSESV